MQKLFLFLLCVNIVLYLTIAEVRTLPGDILDTLYNKQQMTSYLNNSGGTLQVSEEVDQAVPKEVKKGLINEAISFITDGLAFAWDLIKLFVNIITIPFALFGLMHPVISILIAVPLSGLWILLLAQFFRGVVVP